MDAVVVGAELAAGGGTTSVVGGARDDDVGGVAGDVALLLVADRSAGLASVVRAAGVVVAGALALGVGVVVGCAAANPPPVAIINAAIIATTNPFDGEARFGHCEFTDVAFLAI
ncbi:hypothetical protein [Rhodococcus jostii]|uniref:hypothetical protein n=1 Tax=Rhodococcus jostii TaxID=132919 RepID=UPI0011D10A55|nr:hypothetical protein [Rhodococcus jostii]